MNDVAIQRLAQQLANEITAGRRSTSFTTTDPIVRERVLGAVRNLLAGKPALEETPD